MAFYVKPELIFEILSDQEFLRSHNLVHIHSHMHKGVIHVHPHSHADHHSG